jgi:hypothetical protein
MSKVTVTVERRDENIYVIAPLEFALNPKGGPVWVQESSGWQEHLATKIMTIFKVPAVDIVGP